ncbi:MAG: preprotein translocase subunit SecA, partial [Burkholderiales bacterium]|nr:preprotein translocase subunit SecA [Burkholderiales bacterium]
DRQLFGRCGRQGDPGSYQVIVSLDDEVFQHALRRVAAQVQRMYAGRGRPLPRALGRMLVDLAQGAAERHHGRIRRDLLKADDQLSDLLAFTGRGE